MSEHIHNVLAKEFSMTKDDKPTSFLGMVISESETAITLSQPGFIKDLLERYGFTDARHISTPAATQKLEPRKSDEDSVDVHLVQQLVGSLQYLASGT